MYTLEAMLQFAILAFLIFVAIYATRALVMNNGLKGIFSKHRRPRYARTANK